jgi:hypothetical protein
MEVVLRVCERDAGFIMFEARNFVEIKVLGLADIYLRYTTIWVMPTDPRLVLSPNCGSIASVCSYVHWKIVSTLTSGKH